MRTPSESLDNNSDITPARRFGDFIPGVVEHLAELSERAAKHRKEIERFASKLPKQKPCPQGGGPHVIDVDAISRASWAEGKREAIYAPCVKCRQESNDSQWMTRAGVPSVLAHASLDNWKTRTDVDKRILSNVREFAENGNGFLILSGQVGLGKSHLAVAVMRKRGYGRIITQTRLILKLRERYQNQFAEDVISKCKVTKLLVLDECGFMTGGRDELPAIYEILDYRHGETLPTVLTTNIPVSQFDEAFGDRLADRLRCHQPFVVLSGQSWRGASR